MLDKSLSLKPDVVARIGPTRKPQRPAASQASKLLVPYNRPPVLGREIEYVQDALQRRHFSGDGHYTHLCQEWFTTRLQASSTRLTHSCTAALEMAAILADVGPGDEVVMPSFTFVSTANAFVLRGATPVFVDIDPDTLDLDPDQLERAITDRTKAVVVVHYAGVIAEMNAIADVARRHRLLIIEDAAQALGSYYHGRPAGSLSNLACFSFHETKNVVSGEGGALVVNDDRLVERADVIREKGTNRTAFHKRLVDKYTWVDIGSSYLPSEITAAFLWAQLENAEEITASRTRIWARYQSVFRALESSETFRCPIVPDHCTHNGHIYYLLMPSRAKRDDLITKLGEDGILAPFHYVPLHSSPAGRRYGRTSGDLTHTNSVSERLLRLPLFMDLGDDQEFVIDRVLAHLTN